MIVKEIIVLLMRTKPTNAIRPFVFSSASILASVIWLSAAPTKIVTGPDTGFPPQVNTYSPTGISTGSGLVRAIEEPLSFSARAENRKDFHRHCAAFAANLPVS